MLCKTNLSKFSGGRSFNQQTCSFPKGKFNLSRAHRNAFIADLYLAILLWSCFHSIISQILDMWFFTPEGYKVVGMSCNGNKSNFYLQSTLISIIQSKHILGLTTSLVFQIKLQYKLGPAGQLAMLNEKCVIRKMYFLWYSLYMVLFCTSNYFDYFTNKAWQVFFLLLLIKRVFLVCLFFKVILHMIIPPSLDLLQSHMMMLLMAQLHLRMKVNAFLYASWLSSVHLEKKFYKNLHENGNIFI